MMENWHIAKRWLGAYTGQFEILNSRLYNVRPKPMRGGFRFTHDVLWQGEVVGQASEVSTTGHAFVQFYGFLPGTATLSQDVDPICELNVTLRIREQGGPFAFAPKEEPLPIPGRDQLDDDPETMRLLKQLHPEVLTW